MILALCLRSCDQSSSIPEEYQSTHLDTSIGMLIRSCDHMASNDACTTSSDLKQRALSCSLASHTHACINSFLQEIGWKYVGGGHNLCQSHYPVRWTDSKNRYSLIIIFMNILMNILMFQYNIIHAYIHSIKVVRVCPLILGLIYP